MCTLNKDKCERKKKVEKCDKKLDGLYYFCYHNIL